MEREREREKEIERTGHEGKKVVASRWKRVWVG